MDKKFNTFTIDEYKLFIDSYEDYADFNTLGLYRSIIESELLSLDDKIEVREYAHLTFRKTFEFLQLKDPETFFKVDTLGLELTKGDEDNIWETIKANQQKILSDKKLGHRNFGTYAKHLCGHDWCPLNGLMIRQRSSISYGHMWFKSDKNKNYSKVKSERIKSGRRNERKDIQKILETE